MTRDTTVTTPDSTHGSVIGGYLQFRRGALRGFRHYTWFVRLMRLALPAGALLLAVAMAFWPSLDEADTHTHDRNEAEPGDFGMAADERSTMSNVRYLGTDSGGQPFTVTAATAWQERDSDWRIHLEDVRGSSTIRRGEWTTVRSDRGVYDQAEQILVLESDVSVFTDEGYELHSERVSVDLDRGTAESGVPVSGHGPVGRIEAQGFRVSENGNRILFDGRVHLTLTPDPEH